jgi:hypothetical protein
MKEVKWLVGKQVGEQVAAVGQAVVVSERYARVDQARINCLLQFSISTVYTQRPIRSSPHEDGDTSVLKDFYRELLYGDQSVHSVPTGPEVSEVYHAKVPWSPVQWVEGASHAVGHIVGCGALLRDADERDSGTS